MARNHELDQPAGEWDPEFEGVRRAPNSHQVIDEDDLHRKLLILLPPGAREPLHHHPWASTFILFKSTLIKYYDRDGNSFFIPKREVSYEVPYVEELAPERLHSAENLSTTESYMAFRIEHKPA